MMAADDKVIDGDYDKRYDCLLKRCALLTVIANDTGIRSDTNRRGCATGLMSLKRAHITLTDATRDTR